MTASTSAFIAASWVTLSAKDQSLDSAAPHPLGGPGPLGREPAAYLADLVLYNTEPHHRRAKPRLLRVRPPPPPPPPPPERWSWEIPRAPPCRAAGIPRSTPK